MRIDVATWLKDHAWLNWLIAVYAAIIATWNAINAWLRDISRFKFTLIFPPSYKHDDLIVTVIYRGGPPVKVKSARARVVTMEGLRWFEKFPAPGTDVVLRPENREVQVLMDSEYLDHFWYIDVFTEGGGRRRRNVHFIPKLWLKEVDLGIMSQEKVGGVAIPGQLEKSLRAVVKAAKKERNKKL